MSNVFWELWKYFSLLGIIKKRREGFMTIYDMIIVGSGPAGLAAALYAKRACLNMLVLEKNFMSGGQVLNTYEVDNYPGLPGIGGFDLGMKLREHADGLGAEFVTADVKKIHKEADMYIVETDQGEFAAKTVVIASGAHKYSRRRYTGGQRCFLLCNL